MEYFTSEEQEKQYCETVDKMREMRIGYEVSQKRLAELCGISRQYLNEIEGYKKIVSERQLQKMCMFIRQEAGEEPLEIIIDYFRVRIPTQDVRMVLEEILRMKMERFLYLDYGLYGYNGQYIFGDITVMVSPKKENGVLIELKGKGCRQFERFLRAQGRTWYTLMREIIEHHGVWKRIDIAINDKFGILDIPKLVEKRKRGEYGGYLKKFKVEQSGKESGIRGEWDKAEMGTTLYLGSTKSDIYFCIYEKDYEQMEKNDVPLVEAKIKNRFEIRLKEERAEQAILDLVNYENPATTAFGIINHYAWFLKSGKEDKKESANLDEEWLLFIGKEEKNLKLTTEPEPYDIERTKKWIVKQVMPSLKGLVEMDSVQGTDFVENVFNQTKINEKFQKMIEQAGMSENEVIL